MATKRDSLWKSLDWVTVLLYLILVTCGWFSVCGASYDFADHTFFDFATRAGKQFVWIVCSFGLGFVLLMLDDRFYDTFAYLIYAGLMALLVVTIFIAPDTKGSHSWLILGPVSLQPAEFAKFATALALAKLMDTYGFALHSWRGAFRVGCIIIIPLLLIILQQETGSALVYLSFLLMLYREGMSGTVLLAGLCAVVYFIVGISLGDVPMGNDSTSMGQFVALSLMLALALAFVWVQGRRWSAVRIPVYATGGVWFVSLAVWHLWPIFNPIWVVWILLAGCIGWLLFRLVATRQRVYALSALFTVCSIGFFYSSDYVFHKVLQPHQQVRIRVLLGMESDPAGAGYNVAQSKIAIGSGGLAGKGFLNGTQTKLKYVPEQDTDFIFCTVGEEQGFLGSTLVLLVYAFLLVRLLHVAERQPTVFGRIYGYSVLSIFFFHLTINIGMVLGLMPVIGIPLPFFSYGGSSLWGFTILLFIFLRIDAGRKSRTNG